MDCHRYVVVRFEHRVGASDRPCRCRRFVGYGDGPLGDSGVDDSVVGLGLRAFLLPQHGLDDARVLGAALQLAVAHHSVDDFAHQLRDDEGRRDGLRRRSGLPAGVRHSRVVGHRLLLDCGNRTGAHHGALHHRRRYGIRLEDLRTANAYPFVGVGVHSLLRVQGTRRLGSDDGDLFGQDGQPVRRYDGQSDSQQRRPRFPVVGCSARVVHHRFLVLVYRPVHRAARAFGA